MRNSEKSLKAWLLRRSSAKHKGNKDRKIAERNNKRQVSIAESISNAKKLKADRDDFIKSTVRAFLKANIPLEKLDKPEFRQWLNKYVLGEWKLISGVT